MTEQETNKEFDDYISKKCKEIDADNSINNKNYNKGLLYFSFSNYKTSLHYLQLAFDEIKPSKEAFIHQRLYLDICLALANNYDLLNQYDKSEETFLHILSLKLGEKSYALGDYAYFLHRRKKEYDSAEKYYKLDLEYFPNHSSIHLKYAGFLRMVRKDLKGSEKHYKLSIETNPKNSDALGSYASFLHGVVKDFEAAMKYYELAVEADQFHVNNLCNFGLFLSEEKKEYSRAEEFYKYEFKYLIYIIIFFSLFVINIFFIINRKALMVSNAHANSLYNYAVMLDTHCDRKLEAEGLYRRALEIEPNHPYALYNLAVLLEDKYKNNKETQNDDSLNEIYRYFKKAFEADPSDPIASADFGRYKIYITIYLFLLSWLFDYILIY